MLTDDLRRVVRTVITDNEYVVQLFRVVKLLEILHKRANNLFFVVGCYQHRKRFLRRKVLLFLFLAQSEQREAELIDGDQRQDGLERYKNCVCHDPVMPPF
ncbi:hypothetical protein D3C73_1414570 [compost metagenome]